MFDLPAPEQSLGAQEGSQQCGSEIDGQATLHRPTAEACEGQLSGHESVLQGTTLRCSGTKGPLRRQPDLQVWEIKIAVRAVLTM
jgi:hypothetical protein